MKEGRKRLDRAILDVIRERGRQVLLKAEGKIKFDCADPATPLEHLLYEVRIAARRLSNAAVVFAPDPCWDRQNVKFSGLMPPTVPVVGSSGTRYFRPPSSLLEVPVPSLNSEVFSVASSDFFRFFILASRRSNFLDPP